MLSLILPTFNEARNFEHLLPQIEAALRDLPHEVIIVDDDSPDGTAEVAERVAQRNRSLRVLRRVGRRGLSSAVVEGFALAKGDILAVIDCDGQHDPRLLPDLARAIQAGAHLAVASRYARGGSTGGWAGPRLLLSRLATFLVQRVPRTKINDPMSGYFAVRRSVYRSIEERLRPTGFKILLEILAHLPPSTRVVEVPMTFGLRQSGESKMSLKVQGQFLMQLLRIGFLRMRNFLWEAQWVVLFLFFAAVLVPLLVRAWNVRLLTLDSRVRVAVTSALQEIADQQGWLLSDIHLTSISPYSVRFIHRHHLRGRDPVACYILRFEPLTLIPCAH